jgi:hypothetical protein
MLQQFHEFSIQLQRRRVPWIVTPNNCFRDPRARVYAAQTAEAIVGLEFRVGH